MICRHPQTATLRGPVLLVFALAFVAAASPARADSLTAVLTYPMNGATGADLTQPMQWTSVPGAQAYYLYVGTSVGALNLVNTGAIQETSYLASVPVGQTLYARLWTNAGGVWRYVDSTFSAAASAPLTATVTFPADGAVNANLLQPIQWTSVASKQAYYLYVGTTAGAFDLVNTGEIQQTSYLAANLPAGQTLYARLWTKAGNVWRYTDSTFTVAPVKAVITSPASGAVNADPSNPIQWTSVAGAQAYYLYVGTSPGAKDLVNTGETTSTSHPASGLPLDQTVYARIWTNFAGSWRYTDSTFSLALRATLITPANGAANVDQLEPATWTAVEAADAYYLYVGSTPGTNNVIDSHETQATSFPIAFIPAGQTLYARLWTKVGTDWGYRDSTFTAAPLAPEFVYPLDGGAGVSGAQPFQWTPPANATSHMLRVGTSPGASDIFDSGAIASPAVTVPGLPAAGTVYARAMSFAHGQWLHTDIAFTPGAAPAAALMVAPSDGTIGFDTVQPFEWQPVPLARAYRLRIGTAPGVYDLHDSGEIAVTRRFVPNLPIGELFGRIDTKLAGQWHANEFTFSVGANTTSAAITIHHARWATSLVRAMALADNRPFSWTPLATEVASRLAFSALCNDFAETLLNMLSEMNIQLTARRLDISLNTTAGDAHTLVELFDPDTARWMLLDPTFDLTARRTADNLWATAEDVSTATRTEEWNDISYEFLGPLGDSIASSYYLDYPLLFVNIQHADDSWGAPGPVLPYLEPTSMPVVAEDMYIAGCAGAPDATLMVSGSERVLACGADGLSSVFGASDVAPAASTAPSVVLYRVRRFVF